MRLSIILPVYNGETHVKRAIQSALQQHVSEVEVIVVDDASTDGTVGVVESLTQTDSRIQVCRLEDNVGVHAARHEGVKRAVGKYVGFLDADDWIGRYCYQDLIAACEESNSDAAICGMFLAKGSGGNECRAHVRFPHRKVYDDCLFERFCSWEFKSGSLCNKVYRSELIKSLDAWSTSRRVSINEDYLVNINFFMAAKRVVTISEMGYFAFEDCRSVTRTSENVSLLAGALVAYLEAVRIIGSDDEESLKQLDRLFCRTLSFPVYSVDPFRVSTERQLVLNGLIQDICRIRPEFLYKWATAKSVSPRSPRRLEGKGGKLMSLLPARVLESLRKALGVTHAEIGKRSNHPNSAE
ncbi:glycosyltransferase family 2 protein [Planctomycetes bacterium TBK1r]|uniref:Glycosyltransferase EpsJ n=1 Tax=Stieleria magnilauensis TaxID=2527963 RepID=A0ABX5XSN5_9BACT|nr:putative glycosyltransferase EpsJ [Planctomycetes bacterium TBK1r]